jgi:4'-phosphopantetheinyl transferase
VNTSTDCRFSLADGAVEVWQADLHKEEDAREVEKLLSAEERERAARFRFPEHRRRFVVARGCLRQLLSRYLGLKPREIILAYSDVGKPRLADCYASNLQFNVSHSGDIAAFAFTVAKRIGVDVEIIRQDLDVDGISRRFFSPLEQQTLATMNEEDRYLAFFNCWTRKEAYVKAVGSGLSLPLRDFDVALLPHGPAALLETRPDPALASHWSMAALDFGPTCAAAVVVERPVTQIQTRYFIPQS